MGLLSVRGSPPAANLGVECVESICPEVAVALEPFVQLGQRSRFERVQSPLGDLARPHEAVVAEDAEMARDARSTGREVRGDLAGAPFAVGEELDDTEAGGLREDFQCLQRSTSESSLRNCLSQIAR
jgi:hypothetical protein